ncbi:MAG: hypothetical protein Q8R79_07755 [Legionellaceae bacterium]|nr:hypothetical protein [Legionellaceae bacterium]
MLRFIGTYFVLSLLVIYFQKQLSTFIIYLDTLYTKIHIALGPIFNPTGLGLIIQKTIVLTCLPLAIVAIPAILYRLIKKSPMPYLQHATWCIWFVVLLSNLLIH